jgi:glycerol-3-phosphate dehydrogenase
MKTVVLGSGGWGTALAMVLCANNHDVTLWSHNPQKAEMLRESRENPLLKGVRLPDTMKISGDMECLREAELVVFAPPSYAMRSISTAARPYLRDGAVLSKKQGGEWGLAMLPERWHMQIQAALAVYAGEAAEFPADMREFAAWMLYEIRVRIS